MSLKHHIFLVGFMGSGKTTVGELLAGRLGCPFLDLDAWVEERQGMTIAEIFARQGEEAFRELERQALQKAVSHPASVIALGGGAFSDPLNRRTIGAGGTSVWLQVELEEAAQRCLGLPERPLAQDPERFRQLYESRLAGYAQATIHISTRHCTPEQVCQAILAKLRP